MILQKLENLKLPWIHPVTAGAYSVITKSTDSMLLHSFASFSILYTILYFSSAATEDNLQWSTVLEYKPLSVEI